MKKLAFSLIFGILFISLVFAAGPGSGQGSQVNTDTVIQNQGQIQETNIEQTQEANQGEGTMVQNQVQDKTRVKSGDYISENGKNIKIEEKENNRLRLNVGGASAYCDCNLTEEMVQNRTRLKVKLKNGKDTEVKIMPDVASNKALERLRLKNCVEANGCSIELKEVGSGNGAKLAYELKRERTSRLFGLFKMKMKVQAQVDAENGNVIQTKKPWWAFLASEPEEIEDNVDEETLESQE